MEGSGCIECDSNKCEKRCHKFTEGCKLFYGTTIGRVFTYVTFDGDGDEYILMFSIGTGLD